MYVVVVFGILIAHLWASACPDGLLDIYVVRVILFLSCMCVCMAFSCASGDSKSLCICTRRDICVSYTRGVCELSYMYAVHLYGRMCSLVYPVNLCVHIYVQRMFWFTSICAYIQDGGCSIFVHACIEGLYMSPHPSLHVVCTRIHVLCTLRMYMHERVRTP